MKDISDLLARIFISLIFFYEAYDLIAFFGNAKEEMISYGLTWRTDMLLVGAIVFLIIGSSLVLIGYYANVGSILLMIYWIPFTFIVYSFWNDPEELKRLNSLQFMRNLAICAALLLLLANGTGKYSIRRMIHVLRLPDD